MQDTSKVMEMAGYCAGHSIWSVCDGETLIPIVGYLGNDSSRNMERLVMDSVSAVVQGERKLASLNESQLGAVLIKDGLVTLTSGKTDCLILDIRFASEPGCKLQYLVPYRNGHHELGFAVHRPVLSLCEGFSDEQVEILSQFFFKGLAEHEQGSAVWNSHYIAKAGVSVGHEGEETSQFTLEEFQLLRRAPLLVFFLVAAADGKVDKKEVQRLATVLGNAGKYLNPLLTRIVTNVINDLPALVLDMLTQEVDFTGELRVIRQIFEAHLSAEEARAFARALLAVATDIANASGGFFGLGNKISKQEQAALQHITLCLGLDEV